MNSKRKSEYYEWTVWLYPNVVFMTDFHYLFRLLVRISFCMSTMLINGIPTVHDVSLSTTSHTLLHTLLYSNILLQMKNTINYSRRDMHWVWWIFVTTSCIKKMLQKGTAGWSNILNLMDISVGFLSIFFLFSKGEICTECCFRTRDFAITTSWLFENYCRFW